MSNSYLAGENKNEFRGVRIIVGDALQLERVLSCKPNVVDVNPSYQNALAS